MSIRCDNCGWNNPDTATTCVKCNQPITPPEQPTPVPEATPAVDTRATIIMEEAAPAVEEPAVCPKCRYPIAPGSEYCPNCGYTVAVNRPAHVIKEQPKPEPPAEPSAPSMNQTMMESAHPAPNASLKRTVMETPSAQPNIKATMMESAHPVPNASLKATVMEIARPAEPAAKNTVDTEPDIRLVPADSFGIDNLKVNLISGACQIEPAGDVPVYIRIKDKIALKKGDELMIGTSRFIVE